MQIKVKCKAQRYIKNIPLVPKLKKNCSYIPYLKFPLKVLNYFFVNFHASGTTVCNHLSIQCI